MNPRVIYTVPENGAVLEVPEEGKEIIMLVEYDQEMDYTYSWCYKDNREENPEVDDPPIVTWNTEGNICTLNAKLYPNREYKIYFNLPGMYEGFRSKDGLVAIPHVLRFKTILKEVKL